MLPGIKEEMNCSLGTSHRINAPSSEAEASVSPLGLKARLVTFALCFSSLFTSGFEGEPVASQSKILGSRPAAASCPVELYASA